MKKTIIIFLSIILIFSNLTTFQELSGINKGYYRYSNLTGTITSQEIFRQGRVLKKEFAQGKRDLTELKKLHPEIKDFQLYRLFKMNPLKFWRWAEYIYDWRYRLPYASWEDIEKTRGYGDLEFGNGFQEF